jgi:putative ABC transport system substrate-binding protein
MIRIGRRRFLLAGGLSALAPPLLAQQPPKIPRVGVLASGSTSLSVYAGFAQGMRELGYVDGKNIIFERRSAEGNYARLPVFAAELVRMGVDVIHAGGSPSVLAAKQATQTIPIVIAGIADPVALGLVASLSRPEGNVTGPSLQVLDVTVKHLEFLRALRPRLSRVAVLLNPASPIGYAALKQVQAAAAVARVSVASFEAANENQIDAAFAAIASARLDALITVADPFLVTRARQIVALALKARLIAIFPFRQYVEVGGLMSYGEDINENYRRSAAYVHKILKGAAPAELPVEQPTKHVLLINRTAAKMLDLQFPQELLLRVDETID